MASITGANYESADCQFDRTNRKHRLIEISTVRICDRIYPDIYSIGIFSQIQSKNLW